MAVKIPIYDQQTSPQGMLDYRPNPERIIPAVNELPDAVGNGLERLGSAMVGGASAYAEVQKKLDATEAATRVGNGLSDAYTKWLSELDQAKKGAPLGASNFTSDFMERFTKYQKDSLANETNEHGRALLAEGLNSLGRSLFTHSLDFEQKSRVALATTNLDGTIDNWSKLVYRDPSQYQTARTEVMRTIANMDSLDQVQKAELVRKRLPEVAQYATLGYIDQHPIEAYGEIKQDEIHSPGFEGALAFTLKAEGGLNKADTNGTPSNFGINQKAHPEVDVRNLTQEQASQIYRRDYWNKIGGDRLAAKDPKLAMVAFDTAVMAGVGKAQTLLEKSGGDAGKFMDLRAEYLNGLLKSDPAKYGKYANAWTTRNRELRNQILPEGAPHLSGVPSFDDLPPDKMIAYQNVAKTRYDQQVSVQQQELRAKLQDFREGFKDAYSNSVAMYRSGITEQTPIPRDQFIMAFGEDRGPQEYEQYQQDQQLGRDLNSMQSATPDQIRQVLDAHKPAAGPNFVDASKRYGILTQAAEQTVKARKEDPAGYVLMTSKPVRDAYDAMGKATSPQEAQVAVRRYADASMAEQTRLGVASPTLLSKDYVDSVKSVFSRSTGEDMVKQVNGLRDSWGSYWPQVYRQLSAGKAMPPAAIVIGSGMTKAAASDMAIVSKIPDDQLLVGIEDNKTALKDVTTAVDRAMDEFRQTMIGVDGKQMTLGGTDAFNLFYDQTKRLALYYRSRGLSATDAAHKAAQATVNERYSFVGTYRVPVQVNADKVADGATYFLSNLSDKNIDVPISRGDDAIAARDAVRDAKQYGYWVTAPDESGLVLFNSRIQAPVLDRNQQPIQYTWDQLTGPHAEVPSGRGFGSGIIFN